MVEDRQGLEQMPGDNHLQVDPTLPLGSYFSQV